MFRERLNALMSEIGANNGEIAAFSGFDRTNISHMRSGRRTPAPAGSSVQKLALGIYLFSDSRNELPLLCAFIGCSPEETAEEIRQDIIRWLFSGSSAPSEETGSGGSRAGRKRRPPVFRSFGERLDITMNLAELSNARLSQMIHTDASLISRYRNGVRTPGVNPELAERLPALLYERIVRGGRITELAAAMGLPSEEIDEEYLAAWLFERNEQHHETLQTAESLLEIFDSYSENLRLTLPAPEESVFEAALSDRRSLYLGTEGLREAVLRFLGTAYKEKAEKLFLYSDEAQSWMTGDPGFLMKWASLMAACVKNGTRICIIHNIDRNLSEMNDAIRSWLPLYMSGRIESYYCQRRRNVRFSHTIFLNPKSACIEAFHVAGHESGGVYHYYTGPDILTLCQEEFNGFLSLCQPLLKAGNFYPSEKDVSVIAVQSTLSIATMPEELVRSLNSDALRTEWENASADLFRRLQSSTVSECIPLADDEALFAGRVPVESAAGEDTRFYTPEQYALHIKNIIRIMEEYPGFRFYPISETPFPNMKLLITNTFSRITHASKPSLSFAFTHPVLCRAFIEYARTVMKLNRIDRNTLRQRLEGRFL